MDYKRIYDQLIEHRQKNVLANGYIERHHILPRSLGGSDEKINIVALTGREHYIAHLLLARFNRCSQTVYALWMMQMKSSENCDRPRIKSGRMYEWARKEFAKYVSKNAKISSKGERNSQHGTRWICNIELKENRKLEKNENMPHGWVFGRNKWNALNIKIPSRRKNKKVSIETYNASPNRCKCCNNVLTFVKRKNLFCNRSCKASYTNHHRNPVYHSDETKEKISKSKKLNFLQKSWESVGSPRVS